MKCPRCVQKIHRGAETCPHCGFALGLVDADFSRHDRVVKCLADRAGLMRRTERNRVQLAIDRFNHRFPQLFFCVYTAAFPEAMQLRTFGFWLLNRGKFSEVANRANAAGILLVMDVERKAAGLSYGYHLEPYFDESDSFECLSKAHPYWLEGKHDEGIIMLLKTLTTILERTCRQAKRSPEKFAKKVVPPPQLSSLVEKIRSSKSSKKSDAATDEEVDA